MDDAEFNEIQVLGLRFVGHHGTGADEREQGRRFELDVRLRVARLGGFASDRLEETLDYTEVARRVMAVGRGPSCLLVEHVVERMASALLELEAVESVELDLRKQAPGVDGDPSWVGVRVRRRRER